MIDFFLGEGKVIDYGHHDVLGPFLGLQREDDVVDEFFEDAVVELDLANKMRTGELLASTDGVVEEGPDSVSLMVDDILKHACVDGAVVVLEKVDDELIRKVEME